MSPLRVGVWVLSVLLMGFVPALGHAQAIGWPEAVARLAGERTKAETCLDAFKGLGGDKAQIVRARIRYGTAKAEFDGVIIGLIIGARPGSRAGKPDSAPGQARTGRLGVTAIL